MDDEPLIGVNITIKGSTTGTTTDLEGNYTLTNIFSSFYTDRNFSPWHSVALANNTGNLTTTFGSQFMNLMNGTNQ